ncbi:MAG: hypothetical protein A3J74_02620 [Elusimicrobia bacterium RIFCSPHIGHO2_02_FULL_57_9]|nr:MAG: hypothetical protein A3J74_02620 [Elusimicrobia bacterium RIFCSPHIGHO2_02_FULL_57_9]
MIVDDDFSFRKLACMIFEQHGVQTLGVEDGEAALELISLEKPDLILLDIMLPGIDGYGVLKKLKQDPGARHIPVVICSTTLRGPSQVQKAMGLGAVDTIRKPIAPSQLYQRINDVLGGL